MKRAWYAVNADRGTEAASSQDKFFGFNASSEVRAMVKSLVFPVLAAGVRV